LDMQETSRLEVLFGGFLCGSERGILRF